MNKDTCEFIILCLEDELKRTFPLKHLVTNASPGDIRARIKAVIEELKHGV